MRRRYFFSRSNPKFRIKEEMNKYAADGEEKRAINDRVGKVHLVGDPLNSLRGEVIV